MNHVRQTSWSVADRHASEIDMNEVRVNRKAAGRVASGHPWIFSSDVIDRGQAQPGEAVKVVDQRGQSLGVAHYSSASQITLRMLGGSGTGRDFYLQRLRAAEAHRRVILGDEALHLGYDTDTYRVVHGEADLLP